jgi:mannose-6-phosphate isomerase-like protein (cupin superfamily)
MQCFQDGKNVINLINMEIGILKKEEVEEYIKHEKAWGYELWIHNKEDYCAKILHFNKDAKFSMHFHVIKEETWYVSRGYFKLIMIDTDTAEKISQYLTVGDIVEIPRGAPHQLIALEEGDIFETSTQHFEDDSYRVEKGDSQL